LSSKAEIGIETKEKRGKKGAKKRTQPYHVPLQLVRGEERLFALSADILFDSTVDFLEEGKNETNNRILFTKNRPFPVIENFKHKEKGENKSTSLTVCHLSLSAVRNPLPHSLHTYGRSEL
jgi:hypothetical protein